MHKQIAEALLESLFYRISAIVSLDENERILSVALFSTDWPQGHMRIDENAKEVWLISLHPSGDMQPDEQDRLNFQLLCSMAGSARIRLFLASEYFSCFEVEHF